MKYILAFLLIAIVAVGCVDEAKYGYYEIAYEDGSKDTALLNSNYGYEFNITSNGVATVHDGYDNIIAIKVKKFRLLGFKHQSQKEFKLKQPLKDEKSSSSGNQKSKQRDSVTKTR